MSFNYQKYKQLKK